jgi:peptidoglycan/xylan/chitin deacetylase (PgdA/CDA1 family)
MKAVTLLYHDVIDPGQEETSGFNSADANIYKLLTSDFEGHLDAIAKAQNPPRHTIIELLNRNDGQSQIPVLLTFDDGGASALATADRLDQRGWKGHFFITTNFIGTSGFVTPADICGLVKRGHVVGSHSCSHPRRISHLSDGELELEWKQSVNVLQDILGANIGSASVPGGFYSSRVARYASRAGIQVLFNSEPKVQSARLDGCLILGRFGLQRDSPAGLAGKFARCETSILWRHAAFWNAKKLAKAAGGERWLAFRKWWLAR